MMQSLCIIAPAYTVDHPRLGAKIASWFHNNGYAVTFVGQTGVETPEYECILVKRRRGLQRFLALPRVVAELWRHKTGAIVLAGVETLVVGALVGTILRRRLVFDAMEDYPARVPPGLLHRQRAAVIRMILLVCSRAMSLVIVARRENTSQFRWAQSTVVFRNPAPNRMSRSARPPNPDEPIRLVSLGAIDRNRGSGVIAAVLRRLGERDLPVELLVVGRFVDDSERNLLQVAQRYGSLSYRFEGWRPYDEALHIAAECHIGLICFQPVNANLANPMPNKAFDYMAIGLPFIAPKWATELAEIVRGTGAGLLVETREPSAIERAVLTLWRESTTWRGIAQRGRIAAKTTLSIDAEISSLAKEIRRLADV